MDYYLLKLSEWNPTYALARVLVHEEQGAVIEVIEVLSPNGPVQSHWNLSSFHIKYDDLAILIEEEVEEGLYKEAIEIATKNSFIQWSIKEFVDWYRKAEFGYDLSHQ